MAIKFNIEPYWDDYNTPTLVDGLSPKEKYNKMLFRPGHAVQARELTQLQSMLQNQVTSMGDHLFKEGSIVIPGGVSIHNNIDFLKLSAVNTTNMSELIGKEFTDGSSVAKVVHAEPAESSDPITLYVNYVSGSDKFSATASLTGPDSLTATVASTGFGSLVSVDDGIFYIKKHFVIVKRNTIVLSKYTTDITYDVGLKISEEIIGPGDDESINDNAQGTTNESAPGAHRYSITSELVKQTVNSNTGNFVLLARLENGSIAKHARATDYAVLEDTLARRTFDESGNYTVNPFPALMKDNVGGEEPKLSLAIEPSKAYVRGYEIQTLNTTNVDVNKARDSDLATDKVVEISHSNYIDVSNMEGLPDITTFNTINLVNSGLLTVGNLRVRSIQALAAADSFRLHVFDLVNVITGAVTISSDSSSFAATILGWNLASDTLLYPLPYTRIKTCSAELDENLPPDFNYRFETNRQVDTSKEVAANQVSFNASLSNETFGSFDTTNWIVKGSDTAASPIADYYIVPQNLDSSAAYYIDIDNANVIPQVTILNIPTTLDADFWTLIAPTTRTLTQKSKTLVTNQVVLTPKTATYTLPVNIDKCDVLRIVSVLDGTDDITDHFEFNNGQTDTHYGVGSIQLKSTTNYIVDPVAGEDLKVTIDYFDHGNGDFFTIDSYTGEVAYEDIPSHNGIELRSSVDFRPRMNDGGGNFTGTGASVTNCPRSGTQFETDIQYYLNRIDKVYLDKDGKFGVLEGVSDLSPKEPGTPKDSMVLYHLFIPAYTLIPEEVVIKYIDNRRYTMRDIGKLDRRIGNLEYYTTLSLLESEAANKQILDSSGLSRWKSGFFVDSFTSTNGARALSSEFRAGIDRSTGTLRPLFSEGNIGLNYDAASTTQKTGDLVTLPYTSTPIVTQTQSSGTVNVNPFDVFNWTGTLALSPSSDEWKDTERRPQVIINQDGIFNALRDIVDETVATGTVWNSWQTNWTGSSSSSTSSSATATSTDWWFRNTTTTNTTNTTTTTTANQARSGVNTTIGTETVTTNIGDRVVEINFAPFMRSRIVSFTATRMRPNTQVYAFFDDVNVSQWVNQINGGLEAQDILIQQQYAAFGLVGENWFTEHPSNVSTLVTDANGVVQGTFFVPNNQTLNFKTGDKTFLLTDSVDNNKEETGTSATETYSAKGLIETKENVVISTRVPTIQRTSVSDSRVVTSTSTSSASTSSTASERIRWADPLAQSILLDLDGGVFVTSLELFFTTKDSNIPVQVQIRKMDQGIPTQEVVPFSDITLNPSSVNVNGSSTPFTFESPVYLQDGIEYCFVIMANSNEYRVKYAQIGEDDENGDRISKQPYNGVMFKSQNASTWTPDQNKDLTFIMNRAVFDTANTASVILKNKELPMKSLTNDPFQTVNNSSDIIVSHKNHGMSNGDSVTIDIEESIASINGIPYAEVATTHIISGVERDIYTITTATAAAGTGIDGNHTVSATQNLAFNTVYPLIQEITLPDTGMIWGIKDTTESNRILGSNFLPIIINENYSPLVSKVITSGPTSSLEINGILASSKDNLSPVIDLDRTSAITISNRINNPSAGPAAGGYDEVADFWEETDASRGSVLSKYVTKTIQLDEPADTLNIYLDVNRPSFTTVKLYRKDSVEATTFDSDPWIEMPPGSVVGSPVSVPYSDSGEYVEMEYTMSPNTFTLFALKIVFTSQSTAHIPSVRNLRAVALQA